MEKVKGRTELPLEKKKEIRWDILGGKIKGYVDDYLFYKWELEKREVENTLGYTIDFTGIDERGIGYEFIYKNSFEELSPGLQRIVIEYLTWYAKKRNKTLEDLKKEYYLDI